MSVLIPIFLESDFWQANLARRVSACDNRPGKTKIYVTVLDAAGNPLSGARVYFGTEPTLGVAYDHLNVWGITNEDGWIEWKHLGVPTRYTIRMEDDKDNLIENIRTDLGYEYCKPVGSRFRGYRPVNRPGVYSYDIEIQKR